MSARLVRVGSALAVAGAVHAAVNATLLRRPPRVPHPPRDVPVLIPARDEADRLGPCLRSVVGTAGVSEVVVLDDLSTDATADIAMAAGARVVPGRPPPAHWLGKAWACEQLVCAVAGDVLVFLDADVRLDAGAIPAAVALLESSGLDVVCPFPRQQAGTPLERLVQPLLVWSWLTTLPLRAAERSQRPSVTAACGQFVVLRRAALDRIGGFAVVRHDVLDDLALVRAIKASGGRGGVVQGSRLARCRMYDSAADLRQGYAKSLWAAFGSAPGAVAVVAALVLAYVVPPVAAVRGSRTGAIGYLAGVCSRLIAARVSGSRAVPDAFAHPLSVVALAVLTAESFRQRRRGTLSWRGRRIVPERL